MLLLSTRSTLQRVTSLAVSTQPLRGHDVTRSRKSIFFTKLFLRQLFLSSLTSTLIGLTAWLCKQLCCPAEDKQFPLLVLTTSPTLWATGNCWTYLLETPNITGNQCFASKKALRRSHTTAVRTYWRSSIRGDNVCLMVTSICIYTNSNEYFSHIHALC